MKEGKCDHNVENFVDMYTALATISDNNSCQCEYELDGTTFAKICPRCVAKEALKKVEKSKRENNG